MTKLNFTVSPLIVIKKRKCSRNCIHVVIWSILILSWYIKQLLSVTVLLCYIIKITGLRFENESDTWCYSLLIWNILFHAILKIWEWYFDISIYHFFKFKIWWRQLQNLQEKIIEQLSWLSHMIMIVWYLTCTLLSFYYYSNINKISKYQFSNK